MRYIWDNDLHIHTFLSSCSNNPEQTPDRILEYAKKYRLKNICFTDHCWNLDSVKPEDWYIPQNFEHIRQKLPLPKAEGINVLFGAETDMNFDDVIGFDKKDFDKIDFLIIPINHFNKIGFTITKEESSTAEGIIAAWITRFDAVLNADLPFHKVGLAHLTSELICLPDREIYLKVINGLPKKELNRLFTKAKKLGVGIEINSSDINHAGEQIEDLMRIYRIAKKCGCKFYMGSDSHHPELLDTKKGHFDKAIDLLGLTEDDKFILKKEN